MKRILIIIITLAMVALLVSSILNLTGEERVMGIVQLCIFTIALPVVIWLWVFKKWWRGDV